MKNAKILKALQKALIKKVAQSRKKIAEETLRHYKNKFESGAGSWKGKKWKKRKKKSSEPILVKTGALKNSLKYKIKGRKVEIYTSLFYAKIHNEGIGKMPKRTFIGMEPALNKKILTILKRALKRGI